jgi:hypothetical protein
MQMDRMREIMCVLEDDLDMIALLHPDRRARQASWRKHAVARKRKDPECHVLSGPDLLLDLVHFKTDCNFVGDAISVAVGAEDDRVGTPIGVNFTTIGSHRRWPAHRRLRRGSIGEKVHRYH